MFKYFYLVMLFSFQYHLAQVGIGTTNPQQTLHIASPVGTMRVESLNHINNLHNGGDVDNDGDLSNDKFPLYVDENGDFTLEFKPLFNTEDLDALNNATLPNSSVTLLANDPDGKESKIIETFTITVGRPSILEFKYNLSYEVYANPSFTKLTDGLARKIDTYITVTGQTRKYGATSKCYSSTSIYSVVGTFYNSCTTYITLPAAGTYDININGEVASDLTSANSGAPSRAVHVEFATGNDFLFARLH